MNTKTKNSNGLSHTATGDSKESSKCVLTPENYAAHIREMARLLTEGHTVLHCTASDLLSNAYLLRSKSTDKAGVVMDLQALVRHIRYQADKLEKVAEVINQTELATK